MTNKKANDPRPAKTRAAPAEDVEAAGGHIVGTSDGDEPLVEGPNSE